MTSICPAIGESVLQQNRQEDDQEVGKDDDHDDGQDDDQDDDQDDGSKVVFLRSWPKALFQTQPMAALRATSMSAELPPTMASLRFPQLSLSNFASLRFPQLSLSLWIL